MPDVSPIQLIILIFLAVCLVGAYRLSMKGNGYCCDRVFCATYLACGFLLGRKASISLGSAAPPVSV
jgi:hypothetical protein